MIIPIYPYSSLGLEKKVIILAQKCNFLGDNLCQKGKNICQKGKNSVWS